MSSSHSLVEVADASLKPASSFLDLLQVPADRHADFVRPCIPTRRNPAIATRSRGTRRVRRHLSRARACTKPLLSLNFACNSRQQTRPSRSGSSYSSGQQQLARFDPLLDGSSQARQHDMDDVTVMVSTTVLCASISSPTNASYMSSAVLLCNPPPYTRVSSILAGPDLYLSPGHPDAA